MIYVKPGATFSILFDGLPSGRVGQAAVRILDEDGAVVLPASTAAITEIANGVYAARRTAPVTAGRLVAIVNDGDGGERAAFIEVTASATTFADADWRPTLEEIGAVVPAYTRGSFDDGPQAGAEQGTFDDTTSPTAETVEDLIDLAVREIRGRVAYDIPPRCYSLARACATWHVAVTLTTGKLPDQADEATGQARGHQGRYLATLEDLKAQVRQPRALRVNG